MPLHLEVSNSLEMLAEQLIEKIKAGKRGVFTPVTVVTQTEGINLWLREYIANRLGIAANIHFLTPNDIVFKIFRLVGGTYKDTISRESLIWLLYKMLGEKDFAARFPEQASYLQNPFDEKDRKRMGMATKLADLFDQYQIYRPQVITQWNNTPVKSDYTPQDWQEYLWKKITAETPKDIRDKTLVKEFIEQHIHEKDCRQMMQNAIPEIYLFGLSIFTSYHLDILKKAATAVEVRFFLLNPAPQIYWMDDASDKQLATWRSSKNNKEDFFLAGNPILTNWGKVLQHTFRLMFRSEDMINNYNDSNIAIPREDSLLHKLQANVFYNNTDQNIALTKKDLEDETLSIHSTYTIAAEVEALYQYLVHLVDNKKVSLSARDISVMVSDIDKYEPYIRAVFDNAPYPFRYRIADVSAAGGDTLYSALRLLLELNEQDFTSEKVLQLLDSSYIRRRFKLNDMAAVRHWVKAANIRFGMEGNIEDETYIVSWRYGIRRLMYGICMSGEPLVGKGSNAFYPLDVAEGNGSQDVVRFSHFVEMLMESMKRRRIVKAPTEWIVYVQWLIENMVYQIVDNVDEDYYSLTEHLGRYSDLSGMLLEEVPFDVFRLHFLASLDSARRTSLFISEGITFCSMIPMRSVPFKVVALLGMTAKDFPRKEKPVSFSLLQQAHMLGDRNVKDNDKHLFLETLVSAKEYLYISYVGRSVKDNTVLPPSVLVEELIDYVQMLAADSKLNVSDYVVTQHPLHTYSPKYNSGDSKLYRYTKKENLARDIVGTHTKAFPDSFHAEITLHSLIAFFRNAPKVFYNRVFGVYYEEETILLPETEIFHLDSLGNTILKNELLHIEENQLEAWKNKLKLTGRLPLKNVGAAAIDTIRKMVEPVKHAIRQKFPDQIPVKIPVYLDMDGIRLTGEIPNVYGDNLVAVCFSKSLKKYSIGTYIQAIAGLAMDTVQSLTFILVDPDDEAEMEVHPISLHTIFKEEATAFLHTLVQMYQEGMQSPYPFSEVVYYDADMTKADRMEGNSLDELIAKKMVNSHLGTSDMYSVKSYNEGVWQGQGAVDAFQRAFQTVFDPIRKLFPELLEKKKG